MHGTQVEGLAVLGNLAKGCQEARAAIIREGTISRIVTVMEQHVRSELVQRVALISLWKVQEGTTGTPGARSRSQLLGVR